MIGSNGAISAITLQHQIRLASGEEYNSMFEADDYVAEEEPMPKLLDAYRSKEISAEKNRMQNAYQATDNDCCHNIGRYDMDHGMRFVCPCTTAIGELLD